jgi:membrane protease YdiL (CAAX protease family)
MWIFLWFCYAKQQKPPLQFALFLLFILLSFGIKFQLVPGFPSTQITSHFYLGIATPILGLLPLALLIPLARKTKEWKEVFQGTLFGCLGITCLAIAAVAIGAVHWEFKLPSFPITRYGSNLILTAIPEEAFYRGFIQHTLCYYFKNMRGGSVLSLILTSFIFTIAHIYWVPSLEILGFVFLASLLYGWVYLRSGKIESTIITHFLLNVVHMTFFSYHAT